MTAAFHEQVTAETKSHTSYKSTPSSRSSVLSRARDVARKMEHEADYMSPQSASGGRSNHSGQQQPRNGPTTPSSVRTNGDRTVSTLPQKSQATTTTTTRSFRHSRAGSGSEQQQQQQQQQQHNDEMAPPEAVVSPELLVDALSGHEDGLLAIAERMMEHYDRGYDAMGEAIIDAFADVQKLFQHVVEAAHMEGAAFEASRREEEMQQLRRQAAQGGAVLDSAPPTALEEGLVSPVGPVRHDEFIDQDVKDCLNDAIREGAALRDNHKFLECFELYERACQSASSLLPVDSDHRGRLQLSIARADSMSPDRGCAILRYAMDDVLRSGLCAGSVPIPDLSKRADVVLTKPKVHPSMNGSSGGVAGVVQSSEEQLNSLVEEMKEVLEAPVYKDTPLQQVAKRFWDALAETQKLQNRNEERLEQNLGKLKGEFLLARAEWEEKLNRAEEQNERLQKQVSSRKESGSHMATDDAYNTISQRVSSRGHGDEDASTGFHSFSSANQHHRGSKGAAESIASFTSMAQHARTLVGQFNCTGLNDRMMGPIFATDEHAQQQHGYGDAAEWRERRPTADSAAAKKAFASQPRNGGGSSNKAYHHPNYPSSAAAPHRVVDV